MRTKLEDKSANFRLKQLFEARKTIELFVSMGGDENEEAMK
jgi:hypothetical protein